MRGESDQNRSILRLLSSVWSFWDTYRGSFEEVHRICFGHEELNSKEGDQHQTVGKLKRLNNICFTYLRKLIFLQVFI